MINQKLLQKELDSYNKKLVPTNFNYKQFLDLFNQYKEYNMAENSYDCYGEECCCWQEIIEEGVWDLTLKDVKADIICDIQYIKKYLYNTSKYGHRFYMHKEKNICEVYIYTRDLEEVDYAIGFYN